MKVFNVNMRIGISVSLKMGLGAIFTHADAHTDTETCKGLNDEIHTKPFGVTHTDTGAETWKGDFTFFLPK